MNYRLIHADVMDGLAQLEDASIDSCVTDPPYHLTQVSRGGSPRVNDPETPYGRTRVGGERGFMGKKWDGGDVAHRPETWAEVLRVLKPGAHLVAFSGTRTYHRLACAVEDAGFEIRDMIAWIYGSGFPKSRNLSGEWEGWGTALKPAMEPCVLARKPVTGTVTENVGAFGTGALHIDACRVEAEERPTPTGRGALPRRNEHEQREAGDVSEPHSLGRWPANVVHDGHEEVLAVFPDAPGQIADASSSSSRKTQTVYGAMRRGNGREGEASAERRYKNAGAVPFAMLPGARRGDTGSAARFFYCAKAGRYERNEGLDEMPEQTFSKWSSGTAKRAARNHHPTVKPVALMQWLVRLVTPPSGTVLDCFMGSGSTGMAAITEGFAFIGIDRETDYIEIARRRIASVAPMFSKEVS